MSFIHINNLTKRQINKRNVQRTPTDPRKINETITVLDGMNLEFEEGEMVCILGPSGCGKTSLLKIIAGFDTDYDGEIIIGGDKVKGASSEHIFVFQQNGLLPWMSVWDNVPYQRPEPALYIPPVLGGSNLPK
ncbi:MAG: ATP-binding cassette domain-containing protein [Gammaproteobacteria bacterium]|nr:MAG: ATP-binding cassette domain-containing protein [Gammaproteobacteria bacterium]